MKIKNWTACVQDREKWKKEVVQQLKKVQRLEEELQLGSSTSSRMMVTDRNMEEHFSVNFKKILVLSRTNK